MTNLLIYLCVVTLVSYAILGAYFDGHVFVAVRSFFTRLMDKAVEKKHKFGYFIGYLGSCYFCMSYWVSWFTATILYIAWYREKVTTFSAFVTVFAAGLFSVAVLDILNTLIVRPVSGSSRMYFFPWNEPPKFYEADFDYNYEEYDEDEESDSVSVEAESKQITEEKDVRQDSNEPV